MIKKVFVVYDVDDPYCGYWVRKIFSNEEAAKAYVDWFNSTDDYAKHYEWAQLDYFEEDLFDEFVEGGR